jgi:hypothetical protein
MLSNFSLFKHENFPIQNDLLPEGMVSGANKHGYTIKKVDRLDAGKYFKQV